MWQIRAVGLWSLALGGCASMTRYNALVSTLGDAPAAGAVIVLPGAAGTDTSDLQFKEVRRYVARSLEGTGVTIVTDLRQARLAIFVRYGIGEPQTQVVPYTAPIFGTVPGSTTNVQGTVSGTGGTSAVSGTLTTQPRLGVVGAVSGATTVTSFTRWLLLNTYRIPTEPGSTPTELSRTAVVSTGSSGDLRLVLPYLVASSAPYLGRDTRQAVAISLRRDDPRVARLREP